MAVRHCSSGGDFGEDLNEDLGQWFDDTFTDVDDEISHKECEELFNKIWEILEDENLC